MPTFAVQYLEDCPELASVDPQEARARLRAAFRALPVAYVLVGWNLPDALLDACAEETARAGARLYRWHPLLTGDGTFLPRPEWRAIGLDGAPVPGFQDMPEFTFVCPNRPQARAAIQAHVRDLLAEHPYQGFFLDRIRFPSPASNPGRFLACFCEDCHRAAHARGLDLARVRRRIESMLARPEGVRALLGALLGHSLTEQPGEDDKALRAFLQFRAASISRCVGDVARQIHAQNLEVGLDCFSPTLTQMVGQDLSALDAHGTWIKTMSYGHTMGPAGLPFELLGLADWLVKTCQIGEAQALAWLSEAAKLDLPSSRRALLEQGLTPQALGEETRRARAAGVRNLLIGIELVDLVGVTRLHRNQITADLQAVRSAGADGLVLSWDLWHIPLDRLEQVRQVWAPGRAAGKPT